MRTVDLVCTDDGWMGLYIDGEMSYQNHSIRIKEFVFRIQAAGLKEYSFDEHHLNDQGEYSLADTGCLPNRFVDLRGWLR